MQPDTTLSLNPSTDRTPYVSADPRAIIARSPSSITFLVDDVLPDVTPLPKCTHEAQWKLRGVPQFEALDQTDPPFCDTERGHGLLTALGLAYAEHRPFELSVDDVWLCVVHAIARQIAAFPEKYRKRFVPHLGKATVEIVRLDFVRGRAENDWQGAITEFADRVYQQSNEVVRGTLGPARPDCDSTTRLAFNVALMDALQPYYEYKMVISCGIPSIRLLGSTAEWNNLRERAKLLDSLDLSDWRASLDLVLEQCELAAGGTIHRDFWQQIYSDDQTCGSSTVSGWINVLFPFLGKAGVRRNEYARFGQHSLRDAFGGPQMSDLADGIATAPFEWGEKDNSYPMSFIAGFVGVSQTDDGTVRARLSWAVTERQTKQRFQWTDMSKYIVGPTTVSVREGDLGEDLQGLAVETKSLAEWRLNLLGSGIKSLNGIEECNGLVGFTLNGSSIDSLHVLPLIRGLKKVTLVDCPNITDLTVLHLLPNLRELEIFRCEGLRQWDFLLKFDGSPLERLSLGGANVPRSAHNTARNREQVQALIEQLRAALRH